MDYSVSTRGALRKLCVVNRWFTPDDVDKFDRLFYANENGFSIGEIASIIWARSENVTISSWHDVFHLLCVEHEKYCSFLEHDFEPLP